MKNHENHAKMILNTIFNTEQVVENILKLDYLVEEVFPDTIETLEEAGIKNRSFKKENKNGRDLKLSIYEGKDPSFVIDVNLQEKMEDDKIFFTIESDDYSISRFFSGLYKNDPETFSDKGHNSQAEISKLGFNGTKEQAANVIVGAVSASLSDKERLMLSEYFVRGELAKQSDEHNSDKRPEFMNLMMMNIVF